jgi:hypothetical protein
MREFIRSMFSFSWAMSIFGAQQMANAVNPSKAAKALDNIKNAAAKEFDELTQTAFAAGDNLQRRLVDIVSGVRPTAQTGPPNSSTVSRGSRENQTSSYAAASPLRTARVHSGRLDTTTFITLGEGLAAGMGNFTLIDESQKASFPAQLARQIQAEFPQALIQPPGICDAVGFAQLPVRVPAPTQTTVLEPFPPVPVSNLSVPGFKLTDALNLRPAQPLVHRNDAKQTAANLILSVLPIMNGDEGPLPTQLECALQRHPSFTLIELGYYDVLEAAVKGDLDLLADAGSFRSDYEQLLRSLAKSGSELLVLTTPDPMDTAHFSTVEVAARILKVERAVIETIYDLKDDDFITVNGLNEIGFQFFAKTIKPLPAGSILGAEFASQVRSRVQELNAEITALAHSHGALVYDLHAFLRRIADEGIPVGSRRLTGEFLGGFYLLNGYYPGETGHALIANEIVHLLNSTFGADFPEVDIQEVLLRDPVAAYRQAPGSNWTASQLSQLQIAAGPSALAPTKAFREQRKSSGQAPVGWDDLGESEEEGPPAPLQLPPGLEQVLPLSKAASYFGDAILAVNCRDAKESQYGSCGALLFGGLAMVDSHLDGHIRLKFTQPVNDLTHFEVTHGVGLVGDDGVLAAPQLYKLPVLQNRVQDVSGLVSSGDLNLKTGQVSNLNYYVQFSNTALLALARINPKLPKQPISFPGPYGSAWARFQQRPDGNLDFTFYGSTFLPLGSNFQGDPVFFPLPICGPTLQFAGIPCSGTALHPHLALSTKDPEAAVGLEDVPDIPLNTIQELTLFTHNSSFGDRFGLDIEEWGGEATGRSQVLGRVQLQFGERTGNSVPVAVCHLQPGGFLAPFPTTPVTQLFPAPLPPGPTGFNELLRFPLRTYSLNDLAILDDPFDISVGSVDLATGKLLHPLLHRAFINQDLIFALIRVAPESARTFFLFRGPAKLETGVDRKPIFRFKGSTNIPFPAGMQFPQPDLATGYTNLGSQAFLDPFLWIHAIGDGEASDAMKQGVATNVLASTGDRFSYHYLIPGDAAHYKASFEYENHSQQGKFRMYSLAWVGLSNSGTSRARTGGYDTVTFTGYGIWSKGGVNTLQQAAVQVSTSSEKPYVGIQIGGGFVSNVNTKPPNTKDALP